MIFLIGGSIIFIFAGLTDGAATILNLKTALGTFGLVFVCYKFLKPMDAERADLVKFAGYSIMGASLIKIVSLAMKGVTTFGGNFQAWIDKTKIFFDNITFWN